MRPLPLLFLLPACSAHVGAELLPDSELPKDPPAEASRYDFQVLLESDRLTFRVEPRAQFTDQAEHVVERVLTENGRKEASQVSRWDPKAELIAIAGRVIGPDGKVTMLDRSQVFFAVDPNEHSRTRLAFQLPHVEVGSLLEWSYVISTPRLMPLVSREIAPPVPVEHYRLQIDVNTGLDYAFRTYQSVAPVEQSDSIAYHHLNWNVDHVVPAPDEEFSAWLRPRWVYRNTDYRLGRVHVTLFHGWEDVYREPLARLALRDAATSSVLPKLDLGACGDQVSCRLRAAWAQVHLLTDTTVVGSLAAARPLGAVIASRQATRHEQALLFQAYARWLGLEADLVFLGSPFHHELDRHFPSGLHDDVVVWVRPAGDLPSGQFVDASCEVCEPGVVRETVHQQDGVRAWVVAHDGEHVESFAELMTVSAIVVPPSENTSALDATLEENGDLTVYEKHSMSGNDAADARRRYRRLGGFGAGTAEGLIRQLYPQAKLTSFIPFECVKGQHVCSVFFKYTVHGAADAFAGGLALPLKMLPTTDLFVAKERAAIINVVSHSRGGMTLRLHLPQEWKVAQAPFPYQGAAAGFATRIETSSSDDGWQLSASLIRAPGQWDSSAYPAAREVVRKFADLRDQSVVLVKE